MSRIYLHNFKSERGYKINSMTIILIKIFPGKKCKSARIFPGDLAKISFFV